MVNCLKNLGATKYGDKRKKLEELIRNDSEAFIQDLLQSPVKKISSSIYFLVEFAFGIQGCCSGSLGVATTPSREQHLQACVWKSIFQRRQDVEVVARASGGRY